MILTLWQQRFLQRLVTLGGSITVPIGVVNDDLLALIEVKCVRQNNRGGSTNYTITKKGRMATGQVIRPSDVWASSPAAKL